MGRTIKTAPSYAERAAFVRSHPAFADIPGTKVTSPTRFARRRLRILARAMMAQGLYRTPDLTKVEWSVRSLADCLRE